MRQALLGTLASAVFLSIPVAGSYQVPALRPAAGTGPTTLGGRFQTFELESAVLGERRTVYLRLPDSFERTGPDRRYPVVVVLDGRSLGTEASAAADALAAGGQMPEAIVAAVGNTDRLRDLTPPGLSVSGSGLDGGGDRFLDFLERELLPSLERDYRAGRPRVLVGHSSGGVLAAWAAATREAFRFVLALDTPAHLDGGWLAARIADRPGRPGTPLRFAAIDARFGWPDQVWVRVTDAAPAGWLLHREQLTGETHQSMPLLGTYLGFRWLFSDYSVVAAPPAPAGAVVDYYAGLSARYGASVPPPRSLSRQLVDDWLMAGRGAEARQAYDAHVAAYGAPVDAESLSARITEVERQPAPTETVEGLLAMPLASASAIEPFVGDWVGESWTTPDAKSTVTLRLWIAEGSAAGELISRPGSAEFRQRLTHIRVTPEGLAFGYLNGMRPRGVLLYEVSRSGDVLEGTMRLAGMTFTMPNGRPLPVTYIRLTRHRSSG